MGLINNLKQLIDVNADVTFLTRSVEQLKEEEKQLKDSINQLTKEKKLADQRTREIKDKSEKTRQEYGDLLARISNQITLEDLQGQVEQLAETIKVYGGIENAKQALSKIKAEVAELTTTKQDITYLKGITQKTKDLYILLYRSFQEDDQMIYTAPYVLYIKNQSSNYCQFLNVYDRENKYIYTNYNRTQTKEYDRYKSPYTRSYADFVKAYSIQEVDELNGTHYATQTYITWYDLNELCKVVRRHENLDQPQPSNQLKKTR